MREISLLAFIAAICISFPAVAQSENEILEIDQIDVTDEENCPCTPYPFQPDPPCFKICYGRVIANADPATISWVLKLPVQLEMELAIIHSDPAPYALITGTFDDFEPDIRKAFDDADPDELQYLLEQTLQD